MWMKWVVFVSYFKLEMKQLCDRLRDRSRLMLMRSSGVIQSYKWITQHLNPACRVARFYSVAELPVSRLLRAVNDFDLPRNIRYIGLSNFWLKPFIFADYGASIFIYSILSLPFCFEEIAIYLCAIIFIYAIGILFTVFGTYTAWFYAVIVLVILLI
eukprot:gene29193-32750_t